MNDLVNVVRSNLPGTNCKRIGFEKFRQSLLHLITTKRLIDWVLHKVNKGDKSLLQII